MSATNKRRGPRDPLAAVSTLAAVVAAAALLAAAAYVDGRLAAAIGGALATAAAFAAEVARRVRRRPVVDRAAGHLATRADLHRVGTTAARGTAARLGVEPGTAPGLLIGRTVGGNRELWGSWEDMHIDIWGPRTGKTTSRAIPSVVAAPGVAVVTSNKRDIVDATREVRAKRGPVWVFDPQQQAGESISWWWNPLTFATSYPRALIMAGLFSSVPEAKHMRSDGYFHPAAQTLLAGLLFAAARDERPITDVYMWLTRPTDDSAVRILHDHDHDLVADSVAAIQASPERQRAGVYGTAVQMASFLTARDVTRWITPGNEPGRPEFRHADFAAGDVGSLYLLSEESNKAASPVVLALTTAVAYELEGRAIDSPGGRLRVPALFVLDEAASVCPWEELPFLYSHYGSRGIVMMTILQSWGQGVGVWGEAGMAQMWDVANVRVYGGGVPANSFLGTLAAGSGVFEARTTSYSGRGMGLWKRTVTRASRPEKVLDVHDFVALPRGRAYVKFGGAPPVLVRTIPWWEGPHADGIRDSLARHDPRRSIPRPQ
ncbi:type IV secretory system conjugative DNA transfer family protein [Yinghuangia aomiensis]|uniref:Type IV secretory system conjugative DNA transfer family protein n=1 Tax=Yinghuangia aomiensis TaxID=676205 RepID=A0ABP9HUE9_9ACTN